MHIVDTAGGEGCGCCGKQSGLGDAETDLFALHAAGRLAESNLRQSRIALQLCPIAKAQADHKQNAHGQEDAAAFFAQQPGCDALRMDGQRGFLGIGLCMLKTSIAHHFAEDNNAGTRQKHHGIQLDQVGQDGGVFHRCGRTRAKKAAAIGPQVLDDFKRGHRSHTQNLMGALKGLYRNVSRKVLRHALPYQQQPAHQREGQQHAGDDANQIDKIIANLILRFSGQAADESHTGSIAAGRRNKHHKDDDQHLGKIAQSAFACIVLQVGVGHKTDDGVKG